MNNKVKGEINMLLLLFLLAAHTNFQEIIVPPNVKLVEDFDLDEYDDYFDKVKSRFMGWSTEVINEEIQVVFISETLFSYSNQSDEEIEYKYEYEKGKDIKDSVAFTGDIATKAGGKVKGFNLKFDSKLQTKLSLAIEQSTTESWKLDIKVNPFSKVSLKIKGEGELTNGVSKFYFFWIPVKKGGWEILEITDEFFWLVEEHA